jgi:hypothetical protein
VEKLAGRHLRGILRDGNKWNPDLLQYRRCAPINLSRKPDGTKLGARPGNPRLPMPLGFHFLELEIHNGTYVRPFGFRFMFLPVSAKTDVNGSQTAIGTLFFISAKIQ